LAGRHNDLAGLQGGATSERYHMTSAEYTGTGTGVMVRKDGAVLTGASINDRLGIGATISAPDITTGIKLYVKDGHFKLDQVTAPIAPTVATGAAGVLTGDYYYRIAYITAIGETEPGEVSLLVQPSSQKVELTNIPTSSNSNVTGREIYRTTASGSIIAMQLVATINDNITTTYSDNIADISLGELEETVNTTGGLIYTDSKIMGVADSSVTIWGRDAMATFTGFYNTAIGVAALNVNTSGSNNTAVGYNASHNNTTGSANTSIGDNAMHSTTTGVQNTSVGSDSFYDNTTGSYNTAIGNNALIANTTGSYNTAVGDNALHYNTTASRNTAVGEWALGGALTTGSDNTVIGNYNMSSNTTGNWNIAVGRRTLDLNTTGADNTAAGNYALYSNTTGIENVAVGNNAGYQNTIGTKNTFIGDNAGQNVLQKVDATNSMALGNEAYTTASNQTVIGNTSVTSVTINGTIQSPTIASATYAAGTVASNTAPIKLTAGPVLTIPEAGTIEFDGDVYYVTTAVSRGLINSYKINTVVTPFTLSNATGVQTALPTGTLTVSANTTYYFEGQYMITPVSAPHSTAMAFALAGGATASSISYVTALNKAADVNTIAAATQATWINQISSTVISGNSAGPEIIRFRGLIRITNGGTITPQINFSATQSGTNTMAIGSYIKFTPLGSNTVSYVGQWV